MVNFFMGIWLQLVCCLKRSLFCFLPAQTVVQGTQLLAIDTGAAMGLLRRALIGDELTQKEKQALQRTLTDLASVVPIGILMLLPVSLSFTFVFCLLNKEMACELLFSI
jgi:hypothetical protein